MSALQVPESAANTVIERANPASHERDIGGSKPATLRERRFVGYGCSPVFAGNGRDDGESAQDGGCSMHIDVAGPWLVASADRARTGLGSRDGGPSPAVIGRVGLRWWDGRVVASFGDIRVYYHIYCNKLLHE